ncbi:MAG: alcohol dehydrogenase catalytic domain-containing protein [Firmicutes bacterium]|nr:alcohol dehydrogenase catalytic domain-containing protein [Bacillota bacterium]
MKAAVFTGEPGLSLQERPCPQAGPGQGLIRVRYAGICGSDLYICSGRNPRVKPPVVPGHEFVGEIVEADSPELKAGDRVAVEPLLACGRCSACRRGAYHVCRELRLLGVQVDGGFAEYVVAPLDRIVKLPDGLSLEHAVLTEPLAVAIHGLRQATLELGDRVVVLGGGPVGILLAQAARLAGARVMVSEVNPHRREVAAQMGFTVIDGGGDPVAEVLALTDGEGADVVYEAAGAEATAAQMAQMTRIKGQIVVVGVYKDLAPVDLLQISFREQTLRGSRVYNYQDFQRAIELLAQGQIDVDRTVTHVFPLDQVQEAMAAAAGDVDGVKVVLQV